MQIIPQSPPIPVTITRHGTNDDREITWTTEHTGRIVAWQADPDDLGDDTAALIPIIWTDDHPYALAFRTDVPGDLVIRAVTEAAS